MPPHVRAYLGPDREKDALAFVVARSVLVRRAEISQGDRAVDSAHDRPEGDLPGRPGEHVTTADAPLRPDEAGSFQREENLLEVRLGETRALRYVPHRRRTRVVRAQG